MTNPPSLPVMVARSLEFAVVLDHFEAAFPNGINDHIRLASQAATVRLKDVMSGLCHPRCQLFSIRHLECQEVQIDRAVLLIVMVIIIVVVVATKPNLLIVKIDSLHQLSAILHLDTTKI